MSLKLWEASKKTKKNSELFAFEKFVSKRLKKKFYNNYNKIHKWSVKSSQDFWSIFWDFSKIKGVKSKQKIQTKTIVYPLAILLLFIFGYLNSKRTSLATRP